ncbi:ISAs1 family transposase [Tardiphaga sp. 42S5]|uniref:ISAs1 family transposase n=1 Tax=Tardiphaga sp. 42S5 TaxID=1404799 RepID=UPI002A5A18DC|nr:ISAs1 family transposase [Tardiphaga sp. 42S5]WPO42141.1 ISAs1 family transposase [Tardiphaga sp. 42S5]
MPSYRFGDLIVMMVPASLCGANTATEFALFAETRRAALCRLIDYDEAPSHDTFSRLLRLMDPQAFERAFAAFAAGFAKALGEAAGPDEVVAIDGKALRRAYARGHQACPPMTVSAFAVQARLCLGAASPTAAENEIEAALRVIALLDLTDKIVTADALHCHRRMAEAVIERKADYILALKGNRRNWRREAEAAFKCPAMAPAAEQIERSHGREEWRRAEVAGAPQELMLGHQAFIRVTSRRDATKPQVRLFMASRVFSPQQALEMTRSHWQVENGLHWMLDVHLGEDMNRAHKDHAPANVAILKRIAKNILEISDRPKVPISHRIKKCAWNDDYLVAALGRMR